MRKMSERQPLVQSAKNKSVPKLSGADIFFSMHIMKLKKYLFLGLSTLMFNGCAVLHHVQIGEIDNRPAAHVKAVEMKVSETGIDLNDASLMSKALLNKNASNSVNDALAIVGLFQMGPRTGAPVYTIAYIKDLSKELKSQCMNGTLTGIEGIRETRKYPIISGEIVKVKALCITK